MDLAIKNGDYMVDNRGIPKMLSGREELLQQVELCLTVPKGSFCYDPSFGSQLHTLQPGNSLNASALEAAREAVSDLRQLSVISSSSLVKENGIQFAFTVESNYGTDTLTIWKGGDNNGNI